MADISITAANVAAGATATVEHGTFGATVTQGVVVYRDAADGKYKIADKNSATAAAQVARGVALNAGSDGQPGAIVRNGPVTIGATLVAGTTYVLSDDGGISPQADATTGDTVVVIGVATSTSVLNVDIRTPASNCNVPWLRLTAAWDWKPRPAVTVAYQAGQELLVTTACAKAAIAAGKAEMIKKPGGASGKDQ